MSRVTFLYVYKGGLVRRMFILFLFFYEKLVFGSYIAKHQFNKVFQKVVASFDNKETSSTTTLLQNYRWIKISHMSCNILLINFDNFHFCTEKNLKRLRTST